MSSLQKYYRSEKIFITLPSGTSWYSPDQVSFTETGEVGVCAMTSRDEHSVKNPDMLLNGEAILRLIKSCVPAVKSPEKLISNDVDALLVAIRHATYGKNMDATKECPNCKEHNTFTLDLDGVLATITHLDSEYTVGLESGVVLHVRPLTLAETSRVIRDQFAHQRAISMLGADSELSEDVRMKRFREEFEKIVDMNAEIISNTVFKITHVTDSELNITDRKEIRDFLENTERDVIESVNQTVKEIAKIGVNNQFKARCTKCEHEWDTEMDFNPMTFFTKS